MRAGPSSEVLIFDTEELKWERPRVSGQAPAKREMHAAAVVSFDTGNQVEDSRNESNHSSSAKMIVYGGRGEDGVLTDVAILDLASLTWERGFYTSHAICAHSMLPEFPITARSHTSESEDKSAPTTSQDISTSPSLLVYGGFTGSIVQGNLLRLIPEQQNLVNVAASGATKVPPRFAHSAANVTLSESTKGMLVVGGVNIEEDLTNVSLYTKV